ncbi:MAG: hypothetical protein GY844_05210, partial [Bradyrhizobium sp.]|nr:hypothetical protein [Bradyrhizobium sp.]
MNDVPAFKPKKSVALSGVTAGNTALCTVGRTGNDLHYRGYDILDFAETSEFEDPADGEGAMFPTGNLVDTLDGPDGPIEATL